MAIGCSDDLVKSAVLEIKEARKAIECLWESKDMIQDICNKNVVNSAMVNIT